MFLRNQTKPSIAAFSAQIDRLKNEIENADAVVIGAGAGLSTSADLPIPANDLMSISVILERNMDLRICIPAVSILTIPRRNIGRFGAGSSITTGMINASEVYQDLCSW
jgi:hypothetical protein